MKFKRRMVAKTSVKKKKEYEFDFKEIDIKKGKKAKYETPHFCKEKDGFCWCALYQNEDDQLEIQMFHSFDGFTEITDKTEEANNGN